MFKSYVFLAKSESVIHIEIFEKVLRALKQLKMRTE